MLHGIEFIDKTGEVIGRVKSKGGPRAGCVRDIYIEKDEKIIRNMSRPEIKYEPDKFGLLQPVMSQ